MRPDALLLVRFKPTSEGGRASPIRDARYGCPLIVNGEGFDCRFLTGNDVFHPGGTYEIRVKFLNRDMAIEKLTAAKSFSLWEGRDIGEGVIKGIFAPAEK